MATDFKTNFFNLQGDTLKERKTNFYRLLSATSKNISDDQLDFEPRDYLESLYKVEALIYFRKTPQLLEILKEGHVVFSCKIVKERWFFKQAFCHINEQALVNDILPQFSYSMRMKILKKVATQVNEERMDKIFDLVFQRYGLFIAGQFVSYCSKDKIEQICQKYPSIKLRELQLMHMFDKDPDLVLKYWQEMRKNGSVYYPPNLQSFYQYVARKDPKTFVRYRQEDPSSTVRLGKRTTKGMIKTVEEDIKADIERYKSILQLSILSRKMNEFHQLLNIELSGSSPAVYITYLFKRYLNTFPRKRRWPIFEKTYREVYKLNVLDYLVGMDEWVVNLALPHVPDIKHKWAEIKYGTTNDPAFLKYVSTDVGLPILREKINLTTDKSQREIFVGQLIENCIENKDLDALGKSLYYVCYRHRNEESQVRQAVLSLVRASRFDLTDQLNDNHWKSINELLDIQKARNEYQYRLNFDLRFKFIEYLYVNNKPDKLELTEKYVGEDIHDLFPYLPTRPRKYQECIQRLYCHFAKLLYISTSFRDIKNVRQSFLDKIIDFNRNSEYKVCAGELELYKVDIFDDISLLKSMISYNVQEQVVRFQIPEGEDLLRQLFNILQSLNTYTKSSKYYELLSWLVDELKKTVRTELENIILDSLFKEHLRAECLWCFTRLVIYFLKNDPLVIVQYYQQIANTIDLDFSLYDFDKYYFKKYTHLGLTQQIIELAKEKLLSTRTNDRIQLYRPLSILMSSKDFVTLVKHLLPTEIKLDTTNSTQMEQYQLQCEISKVLKNVLQPSEVNEVTMKFFQGDYLQSSLTTLYKVNYRIPETMVAKNMTDLAKRAVSARKHAIYLSCEILPVETVEEVFLKTSTTESNASNLKNWITALLKYFSKTHSERLFNVLLDNLNKINENDNELLNFITEEVEIPKKYQPVFIERIWRTLEALKNKQGIIAMAPYQKNVIQKMICLDEILANFEPDFIKDIIKKYLLKDDLFWRDITEITFQYLKLYPNEEQFKLIFETISEWKMSHLCSGNKYKVHHLFRVFYLNLYRIKDINFTLLFKKNWEAVFSYVEYFQQYLALQILVLYKQDNHLVNFSQNFNKMTKELHQTYGYGVQELINDALVVFSNSINEFNMVEFIINLLKAEKSDTTISVAFSQWSYLKDSQNFIKTLEGIDHPLVKIKLGSTHLLEG